MTAGISINTRDSATGGFAVIPRCPSGQDCADVHPAFHCAGVAVLFRSDGDRDSRLNEAAPYIDRHRTRAVAEQPLQLATVGHRSVILPRPGGIDFKKI